MTDNSPLGTRGGPIRIAHMATACMNEAARIRTTQVDVLVAGGLRSEPDPGEMRRADVLEAAAKFLDEIAPKAQQVLAVIRRR